MCAVCVAPVEHTAVLYQRIAELEAELNSNRSSKSHRRGGNRKVVLQDQPVESMRPGTAAGGLIARPGTSGGLSGGAAGGGGGGFDQQQRPATSLSGPGAGAGAIMSREARAARMGGGGGGAGGGGGGGGGAQVLRFGGE